MISAYACYNRESEIQKQSSSGGIFYLLAREVIKKGGIVFGVCYNKNWEAEHAEAETMEGIQLFMGSKYLQSTVGVSYSRVKMFLEQGRYVLFSGTPCQIAGLYSCLGKKYEKLLTVDLICHGVPSNLVWKKYLQKICRGKAIKNINFRDKSSGWLDYGMKIEFEDGTVYRKDRKTDIFMRGFLSDLTLRPSCYECPFKEEADKADITIGDYWHVGVDMPQMYSHMGTSLVLVRTENGKKYWESIKEFLESQEVKKEKIYKSNDNLLYPVNMPAKRNNIFYNENKLLLRISWLTRKSYLNAKKQKLKVRLRKIKAGLFGGKR